MAIIKNISDLKLKKKYKRYSDEKIDKQRVGLIDTSKARFDDELEALVSGTEKKLDENLLDTMVPYADLMTLLLVFFVFFFIISDYQRSKTMVDTEFQTAPVDVEDMVDLNELTITIPSEILYESGKADIKWSAKSALTQIADKIKEDFTKEPGWQLRIEGHTDNVPIFNREFQSNWELSNARALSVVKFFIDSRHFSPDQLQTMGYGEYKPLVPNNSEENRRKNRRVEIKLNKKFYE